MVSQDDSDIGRRVFESECGLVIRLKFNFIFHIKGGGGKVFLFKKDNFSKCPPPRVRFPHRVKIFLSWSKISWIGPKSSGFGVRIPHMVKNFPLQEQNFMDGGWVYGGWG